MKQRTKQKLVKLQPHPDSRTHSCSHCTWCVLDHCLKYCLDIPKEFQREKDNGCEHFKDSLEEKK